MLISRASCNIFFNSLFFWSCFTTASKNTLKAAHFKKEITVHITDAKLWWRDRFSILPLHLFFIRWMDASILSISLFSSFIAVSSQCVFFRYYRKQSRWCPVLLVLCTWIANFLQIASKCHKRLPWFLQTTSTFTEGRVSERDLSVCTQVENYQKEIWFSWWTLVLFTVSGKKGRANFMIQEISFGFMWKCFPRHPVQ